MTGRLNRATTPLQHHTSPNPTKPETNPLKRPANPTKAGQTGTGTKVERMLHTLLAPGSQKTAQSINFKGVVGFHRQPLYLCATTGLQHRPDFCDMEQLMYIGWGVAACIAGVWVWVILNRKKPEK